jgi:hypothetical protein
MGTKDGPFWIFALILSLMCEVEDESLAVVYILAVS